MITYSYQVFDTGIGIVSPILSLTHAQFHCLNQYRLSTVHQAEEEYREALMSGWPIGILKIARYISVDMGEMRYMRDFRSSGYAVWVLLW